MEERVTKLQDRLDRIRDQRDAELQKGAARDRELLISYDKSAAELLDEIKSLRQSQGGAGVQPGSAAIRAFWQALPHARVDEQNCLVLPPEVHFLGSPVNGSKLLIRPHYLALWQQAVTLKQQGFPHLVVRGSPGIGKSFWLLVVLREAARLGLTVVLQHAELNTRFLFKDDTVLRGDHNNGFWAELESGNTLYLVDGEKPTLAEAWTIAAVSPLRAHYWSYHKEPGTRVLFMPVWSEEELLEAQRLVYPHLQEELIKQLYEKWGGSARYCLQWATDKGAQLELQQAIDATDLDACLKSVGKHLDSAPAASHRILHFSVSDDYASATVVFASRYAERLLMNTLLKRGRAQLRQELASRLGERAYASFVGAAFEEIFHNMMETGCELMCRDLEAKDATPQLLQFGPCQTHIFLDKADVSRVKNANYFIPVGKTFEAVDSVLQPDSVFQVFTAEDHKVSGKGLENALQLLPEKDSYKLYFVVPDHRFESFKKQQVKTTRDTDAKVLKGRVASVKQYVLKVVVVQGD